MGSPLSLNGTVKSHQPRSNTSYQLGAWVQVSSREEGLKVGRCPACGWRGRDGAGPGLVSRTPLGAAVQMYVRSLAALQCCSPPLPAPPPPQHLHSQGKSTFCPSTAASPGQKLQTGSVSQQKEAHEQRTGSKGTWRATVTAARE